MPQQVDFKGLAIIEYPDDWTEEQIREDARVNEAAITKKIQAALNAKAQQETAEDPANQPSGFMEHLGDAALATMESAQSAISAIPTMAGKTLELVPPEVFAADPMGGTYIPPEQRAVFDEIHRQRAAESPELVKQRIATNPLVKLGEAIKEDAKTRFEGLPGRESRFWSGQVPQGLGTTVAGVAAGLTTGPMGAFATMFSAEAEDAWDEELQRQAENEEPYNPDKALLKAYGYGAFASAVEQGLGVGRLTRQIQKAFGGTPKEAVRKATAAGVLGSFLVKTAKEAAAGFTEEAIQKLGQSLIVRGELDVEGAIQEGKVGAIVQSGLSAPANAAESIRRPRSPKLASTAESVSRMESDAIDTGVIEAPKDLTEADVADIEEPKPMPVAIPGKATGTPEPEASASILEQIRLTADPESTKAATLITNGTEMPDFDETGLIFVTTRHGIVVFNPEKIDFEDVKKAASGDVFDGTILGMADTGKKPVKSPIAVTTSTPKARNVVTELVEPTEEAIKAATEAQQAAVPGGTTEVKPAADIIKERREDNAAASGTEVQPDAEMEDAVKTAWGIFKAEKKASVSLLQRKLKIGYSRAQAIVDEMERRGMISPVMGAQPRTLISEAAQPATPQAEKPGVVAPAPEGVVAPSVQPPTPAPNESENQPGMETPGAGTERVPEQPVQGDQSGGATGSVPPVRPESGDAGGKPPGNAEVETGEPKKGGEKSERPKEDQEEGVQVTPTEEPSEDITPDKVRNAAEGIQKRLEESDAPMSRAEASQIVSKAFGSVVAAGKFSAKDVTDVVEMAVNRIIVANPNRYGPNAPDALTELTSLLKKLPTQTTRTEETTAKQQFSTPPHLSWLASWVAGVKPTDVVLEPSAGILGLASQAKAGGATVIANELSERRREMAKLVGSADYMFGENAENISNILRPKITKGEIPQPTLVIMNPPFSAAATTGQTSNTVGQTHLEEALRLLPKGGRAVIIMGEGMAPDKARARAFWAKIGAKYSIRANFGINGKEYAKYGTNFGTQIIVIDNSGPTSNQADIVTGQGTVADAAKALEKVRNERQALELGGEKPGDQGEATNRPERPATPGPGKRGPADGGRTGIPDRGGLQPEPGESKPGELDPNGEPGTGRRGEDAPTGTGGADANPADAPTPGLSITRAEEAERDIEEAEVFSEYRPQITVKGATAHPTPLVEPSAMASVRVPTPTYQPAIPQELIERGAISGPQLEQVILAGQAHSTLLPDGRRAGYFIGDGTGVGKGREIAAIAALDNMKQGRPLCVWVSKTSNLAEDAKRDLRDLGYTDKDFHEFRGTKKIDGLKRGVIFTTYTSLAKSHTGVTAEGKLVASASNQKASRVEQLYKTLGPDFEGVIAFDEAHLAGNAIDTQGKRGIKKASKNGKTVVDIQTLFPKARILYVSATGATDVTNLSYADRLGLWGAGTPFPKKGDFFAAIRSGGLSAMEIVARDLKAMGRYLARTLSFKGVERTQIVHKISPEQASIYDQMSAGWQTVMRGIEEVMATTGAANNGRAVASARSALFGAQQRFYNQLLTAIQLPTVLKEAEKDIAAGEQVVLQIVNTNEATLERGIAEATTDEENPDLDDMDLSSRDVLIEYVDKSWPAQKYEPAVDANGNIFWRPAVDSDGNAIIDQDALAAKKEMLGKIALLKAPQNPLEQILDKFGPDMVAEITGRKRRLVMKKDERGQVRRQIEAGRNKSTRTVEAAEFNEGKRRILIFSDAGGTGFSYHAGNKFKNRKRRNHYLIQAGWRADAAIQGFGRTHRSDQAQPPFYKLFSTDIKGHQRFISTIARRLSELGALTGGERKSAGGEMFDETSNLENDYAEDAVYRLFMDLFRDRVEGFTLEGVSKKLGFWKRTRDSKGNVTEGTTLIDENGKLNEDKVPGVVQFLNRLLIMELEEQNRLFDEFTSRLARRIEAAKSDGSYDPGLQTLKALEVRKLEETVVYTSPESGAETKLLTVESDHPVKYNEWSDIRAIGLEKVQRYVVNRQSGRVYALKKGPDKTLESGAISGTIRRIGIGGYDLLEESEVKIGGTDPKDRGGYVEVSEEEAKKLWSAELQAAPKIRTEKATFVTGSVLPIWDRLKIGRPRIFHIPIGKNPVLGIRVMPADVPAMRRRLGAGSGPKMETGDVFSTLLEGARYDLANGWSVKRSKVLGDYRIEVEGPQWGNKSEWTDHIGGFIEDIAWKSRFFIPTDAKKGPEVLAKLLAKSPIVEDGGSDASRQSLGSGSGILLEDGEAAAQRWINENEAPVGVIVVDDPSMMLDGQGVRGLWLEDGTILLNVAHVSSVEEAEAVLRHEGAHALLSSAEGQAAVVDFLEDLTAPELASVGIRYRRRAGESDRAYRSRLAEEFIAKAAEAAPTLWDRFVSFIRKWLSRVGIVKLSNEEVARAIVDSLRGRKVAPILGSRRESVTPDAESRARPSKASAPAKPRVKGEPTQSLPISDTGQPIQPGGRRGESGSEFGSTYVRQKERERQLFADEFIRKAGDLSDAMAKVNGIKDEAFYSVTLGEIIARAAESLQEKPGERVIDPFEAVRIVERGTKLLQALKSDTAQALQAQDQINTRLGPVRAVLSYLELIRAQQDRVLGKKFPSVVSENIRSWMKESARRAIEDLARQLKNPDHIVSRMLRKAAITAEIPWSALFQSSWETQKAAQRGLFTAIRNHPDLATLPRADAIELTNLLMKAWTKEHGRIFKAEFEAAIGKGGAVAESDMKRLMRALPRIVRWLNLGLLDDSRFRNAVAPEYGIGSLDDAQVIRLSELAQQAQATPEGSRRNRVYQEMVDLITSSQGIKTTDLLKDVWFANVLSGLRTWIDVGVGSWISAFTMTARAAADLTIRGKPRAAYRAVANLVRATGEGIANAADIIATGDTSRLPDTQERLWDILSGKGTSDSLEASKKSGKGWQRAVGQLAYVRRIMVGLDYVGALGARDAMLLYAAMSRNDQESITWAMRRFDAAENARTLAAAKEELGPGAKWVDVKARQRELLEAGIASEIRESATNLGKVAALNADPVGFGGILYRAIALMPWMIRAPLGLSFARAAINMAQNASDWMPLIGLANWARAYATDTEGFRDLPKRHPFRVMGLDVPVERRRLIMGAQIGGMVLTAAAMGLFLDDDDDDIDISGSWHGITPTKKSQLLSQGERPLSIRIGNRWISYKNTPFASALAFVGNIRERQRFQGEQFSAESESERLVNAWLMGALYIKDVSALSQFAEVIGQAATSTKDEVGGFNRKLASTVGNTLSGFIPGASMLREIDTITDPKVYRPDSGIDAWVRNIPFARRSIGVGPAVDALGDEIEAPRMPLGRWSSAVTDDPEWETLISLAKRGVFVPVPSKTATIIGRAGGRRQMTSAEYYEYQTAAGKAWRSAIREGRDKLRNATPEAAKRWFEDRTEAIHQKARAKVRPQE